MLAQRCVFVFREVLAFVIVTSVGFLSNFGPDNSVNICATCCSTHVNFAKMHTGSWDKQPDMGKAESPDTFL